MKSTQYRINDNYKTKRIYPYSVQSWVIIIIIKYKEIQKITLDYRLDIILTSNIQKMYRKMKSELT